MRHNIKAIGDSATHINTKDIIIIPSMATVWNAQCFDAQKNLVWEIINQKNLVTNQGHQYGLDVAFLNGTKITSWYMAVFENDYTPLVSDTYATPGYTESTAYSEATRPAWTAIRTDQTITNDASKASFSFNATKTIYGFSLVGGGTGASTKADTAGGGTLYAAARFSSGAKPVQSGYELKVWCSIISGA